MEQTSAASTSLLLLLASATLGSHHLLRVIDLLPADTEGHWRVFISCFPPGSATPGLSPGSSEGKEGLPAQTTGEGG